MSSPNFDWIARPYRWFEYLTFGRALERTRMYFLPRLGGCHKALLLGDGDGRFTARLLQQNPVLEADAVDTSAAMLRLLRVRAGADSRLRTHHQSALDYVSEAVPDLVVTHFFLDCLTQAEVERLAGRLVPALAPGGLWLVSDFRIPSGGFRLPARVLVRLLYLGFRLLTGLRTTQLPDHEAALARAGLICVARRYRLFGVLTAELWQKAPRE